MKIKMVTKRHIHNKTKCFWLRIPWANRFAHGLGTLYATFRTGKFRPEIAFTIYINQFHLPKNDREGLKLVFSLKKWNSNFRLNYSVTDKGPFEIFHCFQNFSAGTSQKFVFHIYFPTGISRNFLQCMEPRRPFQTVCTERFVTTQTTPQEYCDETRAITVKEVRIKEITIDHRYKLAFHDKYVYACNCIKVMYLRLFTNDIQPFTNSFRLETVY